ncbi:MAG: wax ester/triacylglycerol synthase family O-acyltransferase [Deltaproteobacteria bacterium]|nr:wax ester/triacylglycerol synthase family O-acyltransferase [Deltaproteobacteria bacterium]
MNAAQHLDRLSPDDAAFLVEEDRGAHMHIGNVLIAEGPPPTHAEMQQHVKARLHLVPRYRQKLCYPPLQVGRPFWVDDPRFNLEYHVRHTALPAPGSFDQLRMLAGRIFSQDLDRSKPLWELWLVQGLEHNRFAIINKTHRALVGGRGSIDIATVLFDRSPRSTHPAGARSWAPHPEPSPAELFAAGLRDAIETPAQLAAEAWEALSEPQATLASLRQVASGLTEVLAAYLDPPSPTPLNVPIGTHRRVFWTRCRLEDFSAIKDAFGTDVNDVYVAVVSGALNRWLRHRGIHSRGLRLRAAIPISFKIPRPDGGVASRIVECFAPLPVQCNDPAERLAIVHTALKDLKTSRQALGARTISTLQAFTPPALLAQVARLRFSTRLFNLVLTNIPGPQSPLYLLGRQVEQLCPIGFLLENNALMVVMASYNGMLEIGLTADPDALPDLDELGSALDDAIAELREAASKLQPKKAKKKRSAKAARQT